MYNEIEFIQKKINFILIVHEMKRRTVYNV